MVHNSLSVPLVCGLAVGAALILGALLHPSLARVSKGPSADAAPFVVTSDLPPVDPVRPESTVAPLPMEADDLPDSLPVALMPVTATVVSGVDASVLSDASVGSDPSVVTDPTIITNPNPTSPALVEAAGVSSPGPITTPSRPYRSEGVPILMYHYIRVNPIVTDRAGFVLSVTPNNFISQMRLLAAHGFTTVTMAQVRDFVRTGQPLPPKPIAITFDDGYDDAYTAALPVLQRYGQKATFYVVTGFAGRARYLSWDQVVALDRSGMEIGSHTVHHVGLSVLSGLARRFELSNSQQDLQARLGHSILDFCYPGGQVDAASEIAVGQIGYLSATTTAHGFANFGDDPLRLARVRVSGGEGLAAFAKMIGEAASPADLSGGSLDSVVSSTSIRETPTPTNTGGIAPPAPAVRPISAAIGR